MPPPSEYRRAVREARQALGAAQLETLRKLRRDVDRFARELERRLADLDPNRAAAASRIVRGMYANLDGLVAKTVTAGRAATYEEVLGVWEEAQARLARVRGVKLSTLGAIPLPRTALAGAYDAFGAAETWKTLVRGHMSGAAAEADMIVRQAIGGGVRPDELARQLRRYVDGSQGFEGFLREVGDRWKIDLRELEAAGLKGAAGRMVHNSRRIAFTESTNARVEAEVQHWVRDPFTEAVLWELSPDRGSLIPPDECDVFATEDFYGLGAGVYPVHQVPGSPHPWDRCERVPIPPRRPGDPKPLPERARSGGDARIPGSVSSGRARAIRGNVERVLRSTESIDFSAILGEAAVGRGPAVVVPPGLARKTKKAPPPPPPEPEPIPAGPAAAATELPEELRDPFGFRELGVEYRTAGELGRLERPPWPASAAEATEENMRALGWRVETRAKELYPGATIPQSRYVHDATGRATDWVTGNVAESLPAADGRFFRRQGERLFAPNELVERLDRIRAVADAPKFQSAQEVADWVQENLDGIVAETRRYPAHVRQGIIEELVEVARERPIIAAQLKQIGDGSSEYAGAVRQVNWRKRKNTLGVAWNETAHVNPNQFGANLTATQAPKVDSTLRDLTGHAGTKRWKFDGPKDEYNSWHVSRGIRRQFEEAGYFLSDKTDAAKRALDRTFVELSARATMRHELGHILDNAYSGLESWVPIAEFRQGGQYGTWAPRSMIDEFLDMHRRKKGGLDEFAHEVSVYGSTNKAEMFAESFEALGPRGDELARNNRVAQGLNKLVNLFDPERMPIDADVVEWSALDTSTRAAVKRRIGEILDDIGYEGSARTKFDSFLDGLPD